jgi:DNA ligase-1
MNALEVLELLENTSSTSEKQKILTANKGNTELAELLDAALNFKRRFFVKKFETYEGTPRQSHSDTHKEFKALLQTLETRQATGNAALALVQNFFALCNDQEQKWYARILRKNLRAGFGLTEANKAGFGIPDFDVMLAKDGKECKNLQKIVSEGVYVSPKLDGYRCLAVCAYGEVQLYSRNGTVFENFPSIIETLETLCQDSSFILDGEIMSDDFNAMQQTAMSSKSKKSVGDVKYHVFGWVPVDEFNTSNFKMPTKQRLDNLTAFFKANPGVTNLVQVQQDLVYKVDDILYLELQYLSQGLEGAMALPNIPYYLGKKTNRLMKFKTMHSQDCRVVGLYEGEGKHEGRMGGLKLIQENGLACDVGSGFTDDDRIAIWNDPSCAVGRTAEIKFQELTPDGVMRFPVFMRWRNEK